MLNIPSPSVAQAFVVYDQLKTHHAASKDAILAGQLAQLRRILAHAAKTSPFWGGRIAALGVDPARITWDQFKTLPILTREEVHRHSEVLKCHWAGRKPQHISVAKTSGSTGIPLRVERYKPVYDPIYAAISYFEDMAHGRDANKVVLVSQTSSKDHQQVGWTPMHLYAGHKGIGYSRARGHQTLEQHLEWIVQNKPAYMVTSALFASELAQEAFRLGVDYRFEQIISQAEIVSERHRKLVKDAFGCEITDRYSCEELGWLALQCPENYHYHVVSESVIVEIVDEQGHTCPPGVMGRVLVTGLFSYAMPLIRYQLGDLAQWGEGPCSCGSHHPLIGRILGRVRQLFETASGQKLPMTFLGILIGDIAAIRCFQVRQYDDKTLEVLIETNNGQPLSAEDDRLLREIFDSRQCDGLPLHIKVVDTIDWGMGFKREEFVRVEAPYQTSAVKHEVDLSAPGPGSLLVSQKGST